MRAADEAPPEPFRRAIAALHEAIGPVPGRPELTIEEMPAPRRLAPYAGAIMATVVRGDEELAIGRLVVLYDPAGQSGWHGEFRVVAYIRADLEPEIAADPLIAPVGWSWLTEALDLRGVKYAAASGTITRAVSESFGDKGDDPETTELELRASWSPTDEPGDQAMAGHIAAWCDVLCMAAGLPPAEVSPLPSSDA